MENKIDDLDICVMNEEDCQHIAHARIEQNAAHAQRHHQDRQSKGDDLIVQIVAALGHAPGLIQSHLQRQKDARAGDQNHHQREELAPPVRGEPRPDVADHEVLV